MAKIRDPPAGLVCHHWMGSPHPTHGLRPSPRFPWKGPVKTSPFTVYGHIVLVPSRRHPSRPIRLTQRTSCQCPVLKYRASLALKAPTKRLSSDTMIQASSDLTLMTGPTAFLPSTVSPSIFKPCAQDSSLLGISSLPWTVSSCGGRPRVPNSTWSRLPALPAHGRVGQSSGLNRHGPSRASLSPHGV